MVIIRGGAFTSCITAKLTKLSDTASSDARPQTIALVHADGCEIYDRPLAVDCPLGMRDAVFMIWVKVYLRFRLAGNECTTVRSAFGAARRARWLAYPTATPDACITFWRIGSA